MAGQREGRVISEDLPENGAQQTHLKVKNEGVFHSAQTQHPASPSPVPHAPQGRIIGTERKHLYSKNQHPYSKRFTAKVKKPPLTSA